MQTQLNVNITGLGIFSNTNPNTGEQVLKPMVSFLDLDSKKESRCTVLKPREDSDYSNLISQLKELGVKAKTMINVFTQEIIDQETREAKTITYALLNSNSKLIDSIF